MGDDFAFTVAGRADEPEIRRLVAATPMPGAISVRFEREPNYFLGCDVMGDVCEVLIARHVPDGALAGVLCRTERRAFVNGQERTIGGIGQVRIAPCFRGRRLLEQGWGIFRRRELLYVGVIARGNPRALRALVGRAPGAPAIVRIGGITTLGLLVRRRGRRRRPAGVLIQRAGEPMLEELVAFHRREAARRQLAPALRPADFTDGSLLRGLRLSDVLVARRRGSIAGTLACWDQRGFKQDVVDGYGPALRRLGPVYDLVARVLGTAPLPRPGEQIRAGFGALVAVERDDPQVFSALLDAGLADAGRRGLDWLMVGLADEDPLLPVARRRLQVTYRADLFAAGWGETDPSSILDGRVPYVEIATL
ncbi:MAG TPA: hypothetical protein VHQ42_08350 [Candidatus Limnocylindria bacterium]|nr:hypothetical protein [Candidatus Limnocylindria bacterium]